MAGDSKKNWVLVTGATGGIGRALVARLVNDGRNVIAAAREPARLPQPVGPGRVVGISLDLEQPAAIETAAREVARTVGDDGLSGLVNMAGVIVEGPLEVIPPSELRRQLEINVIGPFALTQTLMPLLKQVRGRVVNIGAISAHLTVPFYGPIAASKSALASLNDAMRLEFAQFGVGVFLIEPGAMSTGIFLASRQRRDSNLLKFPEAERLYRPALAAMDRAFDRAGADDPKAVVEAIMKVLSGRQAKPRTIVGKGTGALLMLSHLPTRTRDKMVKGALGLAAALSPAR